MPIIPIKDLGRRVQEGDTLIVRQDLTAGKEYAHIAWPIYCVPEMTYYAGRAAIVTGYNDEELRIDLDLGGWCWSNDMFTGVLVPDNDLGEINGEETPIEFLFGTGGC